MHRIYMYSLVMYSLACFLCFSAPAALAARLDWQALRAAVVKIEARPGSIPGAGCLIKVEGNRGYILTAYHVIKPAVLAGQQQVTVRFYGGIRPFDGLINQEWIDTRNDLAVVVVQNVPVQQVLRLGSTQRLTVLDGVITIGHPAGSSWVVTEGKVSGFRGRDILFSGADVEKGHSGGPLLDEQGQMIGLNVESPARLGVAIQIDIIKPILRRWIGPLPVAVAQGETAPPRPGETQEPSQEHRQVSQPSIRQGKGGKEMRLVSAGWFRMGSTDSEVANAYQLAKKYFAGAQTSWFEAEQPVHRIWIEAFYMDTYEVTMQEYTAFRQATGHDALPDWVSKYAPGAEHPVVGVSWDDAAAYCRWAGKALPTEAQWEKAARGTDRRLYPWGNASVTGRRANYCDAKCEEDWKDTSADDGARYTAPVGSYPAGASPYGLQDLAGNVLEWVQDWYDKDYYRRSPERNPVNTTPSEERVLRGGAWDNLPAILRAAARGRLAPSDRRTNLGFRCVLGVSASRQ
jgi:formylglycine-generating enzyme required for sulfatase activity